MEFKELLEFVNTESENIKKRHTIYDKEKLRLAHTVKLNEEVGELCEVILSKMGHQRKNKLDNFDDSKIENEIADVILCTMIVARSMDIDIEKSLKNKIDILIERRKDD